MLLRACVVGFSLICGAGALWAQTPVTLGSVRLTLPPGDWRVKSEADRLTATRALGATSGLSLEITLLPEAPGRFDSRLSFAEAALVSLGGAEVPFEVFDWSPAGLACRYHQGVATTQAGDFVRRVGAVCALPGRGLLLDGVMTYRGPEEVEDYPDTNLEIEALFEGLEVAPG